MNNYEEKQMEKLERYKELAVKNEKLSESSYESSRKISEFIPFGQPILVGHHSESHHRRDINRIDSLMRKSIESLEKSEYYNKKVENIMNPTAISSDDPDAVNKLKEKLARLEKERAEIKSREHQTWELSNLSQNMRQIKKRMEYLERKNKMVVEDSEINGIKIVADKENNRVKMFFPSIPTETKRNELKHNGFRWSPTNSCWQRQLNDWAVHVAKKIATED